MADSLWSNRNDPNDELPVSIPKTNDKGDLFATLEKHLRLNALTSKCLRRGMQYMGETEEMKETALYRQAVLNLENERAKRKAAENTRIKMTVKEMGDLLGLRKTERYWLVHKNYFETKEIGGQLWVDIQSFEKWYANQVKYHKVNGEEPGLKLKEWSYSISDVARLLGISNSAVYGIIQRNHLEIVTIDYWKRVPKDAFHLWYENQNRYRIKETKEEASADPEALPLIFADLPGGSSDPATEPLKPEIRTDTNPKPVPNPYLGLASKSGLSINEKTRYLTITQAADMAGLSRQAVSLYADFGFYRKFKYGAVTRILRQEFEDWLIKRNVRTAANRQHSNRANCKIQQGE